LGPAPRVDGDSRAEPAAHDCRRPQQLARRRVDDADHAAADHEDAPGAAVDSHVQGDRPDRDRAHDRLVEGWQDRRDGWRGGLARQQGAGRDER